MEESSTVELIFVPVPGLTHLVSSMEFAKLLIGRDDRISITVLIIKPLELVSELGDYTRSISDSEPRIKFVDLPQIEPPPLEILARSAESFFTLAIESYVPVVRDALSQIRAARAESGSARVACLVLDFFCVPMIDVGDEFGLKSYIFLTTGSAFLNLMLYLPNRVEPEVLSEAGPELEIPGFANPVPPMVLPSGLLNRNGGHEAFLKLAGRFRDARGIIVNSLSELEGYASGCYCDDDVEFEGRSKNPKVYMVGPVLDLEARAHRPTKKAGHRERLMRWLDDQPPESVVLLCFGSIGGFGGPQVREIALALERGGFRFLWAIRGPADLLPEGFGERTGGRGFICEWVPQTDVLAHRAIGGFLSHCGWNSVLESLWSGVPIATWPLNAEQQLNAFLLVKELEGLAVEMRLGSRSGGDLVPACEIERALRRLMDGDGEVKKKVKEMGMIFKEALMDGGSSFASIGRVIEDMLK